MTGLNRRVKQNKHNLGVGREVEENIYLLLTEGSDLECEEFVEDDFSFSFTHQGQTVSGVFFDSEFYIGQVLNIINPNLADVTFMASSSNRNENVIF